MLPVLRCVALGVIAVVIAVASSGADHEGASCFSPMSSQLPNEHSNAENGKTTRTRVRTKTVIHFGFDILNMTTNHQFEGQQNSFHVTYEYSGELKGGGFDPKGHAVSAESFPYFQTVRDDITRYVQEYPDKGDFYELFGKAICEHVMERYPQIREITLKMDIPSYGGVAIDRTETVVVTRQSEVSKKTVSLH